MSPTADHSYHAYTKLCTCLPLCLWFKMLSEFPFVELLCNIRMREMLQKASMDRHYLDTSYVSETGIEQLAAQFNKVNS